jgi:hypothetical protein
MTEPKDPEMVEMPKNSFKKMLIFLQEDLNKQAKKRDQFKIGVRNSTT